MTSETGRASTAPITDAWFTDNPTIQVYGSDAKITPPTELIVSKMFIQDRYRYDGADVVHVLYRQAERIDWKRLLAYLEPYWEVLLIHLLNFRFIYPTERDRIPDWLVAELLERMQERAKLPVAQTRICRGRLFSREDYLIDVTQWGFADVVGEEGTKESLKESGNG